MQRRWRWARGAAAVVVGELLAAIAPVSRDWRSRQRRRCWPTRSRRSLSSEKARGEHVQARGEHVQARDAPGGSAAGAGLRGRAGRHRRRASRGDRARLARWSGAAPMLGYEAAAVAVAGAARGDRAGSRDCRGCTARGRTGGPRSSSSESCSRRLWSSPPSAGSTGSTTAVSSNPWATCHPPSSRRRTINVAPPQPRRLDSCKPVSGEPGPVHSPRCRCFGYLRDVLDKTAGDWPAARIDELLPAAWRADNGRQDVKPQAVAVTSATRRLIGALPDSIARTASADPPARARDGVNRADTPHHPRAAAAHYGAGVDPARAPAACAVGAGQAITRPSRTGSVHRLLILPRRHEGPFYGQVPFLV